MSDPERIDLKHYIGEKFDAMNERLDGIDTRLDTLELDRDHRVGRNNFLVNFAKSVAAAIGAILAAIGIKNSLGI
jgi:tetrahydromethanopterin S-methyltransferase subunit G